VTPATVMRLWGQLRSRLFVSGGEATVKACGVVVAKLSGYRWAPHSLIDAS